MNKFIKLLTILFALYSSVCLPISAAEKASDAAEETELPPLAMLLTTYSAAFTSLDAVEGYLGKPLDKKVHSHPNKEDKTKTDITLSLFWDDADIVLWESGVDASTQPTSITLRKNIKDLETDVKIGSTRSEVEKILGKPASKEGNQESYKDEEGGLSLAVTYAEDGKVTELMMEFDFGQDEE